ncbi:MAG TPA: DUF1015 domain-containing protein [Oscillospiraceae bacterium]|nr:DUF1015 domain-containing protein [Oscillospiraceae bacterium]
MDERFCKLGFLPAEILLPDGVDMTRWSVVACDQYTSQPDYWARVDRFVGRHPSTLRMILPETLLEAPDVKARIEGIDRTMEAYLGAGALRALPEGFVYVERTQKDGRVRRGLVGMVDLEAYDFTPSSGSLIRATEGTVLSRIPPRLAVRRGAMLELPHVMVLVDDPEKTVVEPFAQKKAALEPLYDFELMENGGHLRGRRVPAAEAGGVAEALFRLADPDRFARRYDAAGKPVMLFAMGDGNHSLATAKACYEEQKRETPPEAWAKLPARYALVELVNLHDDALTFEPIHRVLFGVEPEAALEALFRAEPSAHRGEGAADAQTIGYCYGKTAGVISVEKPRHTIAAGTLQSFLDAYAAETGCGIDYIHGEDVTRALAEKPGNLGFTLPPIRKEELFRTVVHDGVLPRKTFSMGEAHDKRYYLECRRIR